MPFKPEEHFMKLKGKDYLPVAWRVIWFREEHGDGYITTDLVEHDPQGGLAVFKARAGYVNDAGREVYATGYGSETRGDFVAYLEKSETKAIGRALAMLGYGTAQAAELDEGESVADSPVAKYGNKDYMAQRAADERQAAQAMTPQQTPGMTPQAPGSGPDDALRSEVRMLSERDAEGRAKLPKPISHMNSAELEKTRDWFLARAKAIKKGQAVWVDPKTPTRPFGLTPTIAMQRVLDDADENERELSPGELTDLLGLIKSYLQEDIAQQGIYAAQGISVDEMTEGEAKSAFRWLKERAERRARTAAQV